MKLNGIRVRNVGRSLEPLRCLDAVRATSSKVDDTLLIETPSIIDCLDEDSVQLVDLSRVRFSFTWWLVNRLKSNKTGRASQLCTNLVPEPVELLLDFANVTAGLGYIGPFP